jgi:hypothetical protein
MDIARFCIAAAPEAPRSQGVDIMGTNSEADREKAASNETNDNAASVTPPEQGAGYDEIVVAEPSSVEPGTLEPVVARVPRETSPTEEPDTGWARPTPRASEEPNPYVVRTTVPPMNPHTVGAPLASQHESGQPVGQTPPVAAPVQGSPDVYAPAPVAVPVQLASPVAPSPKGNRLFGAGIGLAGAVVFAVVYALVAFLFFAFNPAVDEPVATLLRFLGNAAFIVPVVFFAIAFALLAVILNRAGWWAFIIGGFLVAAVVYAGSIVGAFVSVEGWAMSPDARGDFLRSLLMDPLPITAGIIAREVSVWAGAWVSSRGRRLKAKNRAARAEFETALAESPATAPTGSPVW